MKRPIPNLATVYRVERILIDANKKGEDPISLEEIKRRLGSKGIRHVTVRTCVDELARQGKVTLTADGVLWTWMPPPVTESPRDSDGSPRRARRTHEGSRRSPFRPS
jgi:hypothetical protein